VDLLEKARRQGHHFDILAKPMKPEQLITVIRAASRYRSYPKGMPAGAAQSSRKPAGTS